MKFRIFFTIIFFCSFSWSEVLPKNKTFDLLNYISFVTEWTSYEYNGEPLPLVEIKSHGIIQILAYGDYKVAQAEFKGEELASVLAVYNRDHKAIYLSDRIEELGSNIEVSIVHEVVHYLQDINGYTESLGEHLICSESEAYDVQMLWQIINGVDEHLVDSVGLQSLQSAITCMGNQF